jgi:hypothetical protein
MGRTASLITLFCPLLLAGCAGAPEPETNQTTQPGIVHVTANGMTFEAPDEVPSGWLTFEFENRSPMSHFVVIERLPEGVTVADHQRVVAPVFQEGMNLLAAGQPDSAMAAFGKLPSWFSEVVFRGGPGLTAPGTTSQSTVNLDPGTYLLECYVKTAGIFHSYNPDTSAYGMVHQFTVTDEPSERREPDATIHVNVSSEHGFNITGDPVKGRNTIAVHFTDQTTHENFVGHDVNLVKLEDDTDLDALATWMDWRQPGGLQTPAPARFVGGLQEMPAGSTGYFTVELEPGRYAWIAEVAEPQNKGMLLTFTVQ